MFCESLSSKKWSLYINHLLLFACWYKSDSSVDLLSEHISIPENLGFISPFFCPL